MRIYDGSPRQNYEEVLRSIGAFLDQHGMREVQLVEVPDGFIVQGVVVQAGNSGVWSENVGQEKKETMTFLDEHIAQFMEEGHAKRHGRKTVTWGQAGYYEQAFRVIGRYIDDQRPRDVFFFEQEGAYVMRLLIATQTGSRHVIAEFTREEVEAMIAQGPELRQQAVKPSGSGGAH